MLVLAFNGLTWSDLGGQRAGDRRVESKERNWLMRDAACRRRREATGRMQAPGRGQLVPDARWQWRRGGDGSSPRFQLSSVDLGDEPSPPRCLHPPCIPVLVRENGLYAGQERALLARTVIGKLWQTMILHFRTAGRASAELSFFSIEWTCIHVEALSAQPEMTGYPLKASGDQFS